MSNVVVAERRVLFRVENFKKRRTGVAMEAGGDLVDLVEHANGIAGTCLAQALDNVAGQCADVRPTMTADLGLIVHAAQAHPHELQPERSGDALTERGFAHPWRPHEA